MRQLVVVYGVFALLAFSGLFGSDRQRVYNFSAGPAALSVPVLLQAQRELLNHNGAGASVFEQSHRDEGGPVQKMISSAAARLRRLLNVPETHEIMYFFFFFFFFYSSEFA
jgi:phosphoserine aminotransferase